MVERGGSSPDVVAIAAGVGDWRRSKRESISIRIGMGRLAHAADVRADRRRVLRDRGDAYAQ